jgi:hypothetical protein
MMNVVLLGVVASNEDLWDLHDQNWGPQRHLA